MTTIKLTDNLKEADFITHAGTFHADEVLATVILIKSFSKHFDELYICRTLTVPPDLHPGQIVFDIGGGSFDHHQRGGNGVRANGVPYASAGLIWKKFGNRIAPSGPIFRYIDRHLIQGVDAVDNGVSNSTQSLSFSNIIAGFNPQWDNSESTDKAFLKAVQFAETVFDNLMSEAISTFKAQEIVDYAVRNCHGPILVLNRFVPWQKALLSNPAASGIQFIVFPSNREGYNWQCVPDCFGGFGQRKTVPDSWKGLSGSALQEVTGIATAIFCHPQGFIGSCKTLEDAIAMATLASEA